VYFVCFVGPPSATRSVLFSAALLVVAISAAWSNSLSVPFVLDDLGNIADNPTIRDLGSLRAVLSPPSNTGVGGRPVLNLSYALNYTLTGPSVTGFRLTNLLIHTLAALTLFALLRHLFRRLDLSTSTGDVLALASASLWALHPVQTQAVTYLSQRAESLMGLFYLLTLYCSARPLSPSPPLSVSPSLRPSSLWPIAAVLACALAMATKEVAATAPLLVLLYDRTFVAGTFAAALRTRPRFYLALASTWLLLAVLLADVSTRGIGTAHGVTPLAYALTSCRTLLHYLRLVVWPYPLVFDYGADFAPSFSAVAPHAFALAALLAFTVYALVRRPALGFLGAWFFLILAPTTSFIPIAFSPVAESRLYLPLAAFGVAGPLALHRLLAARPAVFISALSACAVLLGTLTFLRNRTYATELSLWADTVTRRPAHPGAHYNYGLALSRAGRVTDAAEQWRTTLRLDPAYPAAHNNLANALVSLGRIADSVPHYEAALRLNPDASVVRANFGVILLHLDRPADAEAQLRLAVRQNPANASAHNNLGLALERPAPSRTPDLPAALACYETGLRLDPAFADAHHNAALLLARTERLTAALVHLESVIRLRPDRPEPRLALSRVLLNAGRLADALTAAARAVREFPDSPDAHLVLGNSHAFLGDFPAAITAYESALRLRPDFPDAQTNLARIRTRVSR
jgi:tetratricopeptide (TPR) repeat protein